MQLDATNLTIIILAAVVLIAVMLAALLWQRRQINYYQKGKNYGFLGKALPAFLLFLVGGIGFVGINNVNSPTGTSATNQLEVQILYSQNPAASFNFDVILNNKKLSTGVVSAYWTIKNSQGAIIKFAQPDVNINALPSYTPNLSKGSYTVTLKILYLDLEASGSKNIVVN